MTDVTDFLDDPAGFAEKDEGTGGHLGAMSRMIRDSQGLSEVPSLDPAQMLLLSRHINDVVLRRLQPKFEATLRSLWGRPARPKDRPDDYTFLQVYLDLAIKVRNGANRVQVTAGLRRPASRDTIDTLDEAAVATLVVTPGPVLNRLVYHDKTGRLDTPPTLAPLEDTLGQYMTAFLYHTRDVPACRGPGPGYVFFHPASGGTRKWKPEEASQAVLRALRDLAGIPESLLSRQHALRDLFINEVATGGNYANHVLRHAAVLSRNNVQVLEDHYAPWGRYFQLTTTTGTAAGAAGRPSGHRRPRLLDALRVPGREFVGMHKEARAWLETTHLLLPLDRKASPPAEKGGGDGPGEGSAASLRPGVDFLPRLGHHPSKPNADYGSWPASPSSSSVPVVDGRSCPVLTVPQAAPRPAAPRQEDAVDRATFPHHGPPRPTFDLYVGVDTSERCTAATFFCPATDRYVTVCSVPEPASPPASSDRVTFCFRPRTEDTSPVVWLQKIIQETTETLRKEFAESGPPLRTVVAVEPPLAPGTRVDRNQRVHTATVIDGLRGNHTLYTHLPAPHQLRANWMRLYPATPGPDEFPDLKALSRARGEKKLVRKFCAYLVYTALDFPDLGGPPYRRGGEEYEEVDPAILANIRRLAGHPWSDIVDSTIVVHTLATLDQWSARGLLAL